MSKKQYKKIYYLILFAFLNPFYTLTHAATKLEYSSGNMLEPKLFKGVDVSNLKTYIGSLFDFLIAVAVVLAVIMIIIGGFEYMTTDSWKGKSDGIGKIKDALWGLALALLAYLILWTINPCLVDFTGSSGCSTTNQLLK